MLRFLLAAAAAIASCAPAFAAGPSPTPVKPTALKLTQGAVTRTLPVNPPCLKCSYSEVLQSGQRKFAGGSLGGNWTQFPQAGGPVSVAWVFPPTQCPPIPPDVSQPGVCPPGTTGSWTQTHGWTQAPFPGCGLTARPWVPTSPPPDACRSAPPAPLLVIDTSYVDQTGAPFLRFKAYVDNSIGPNPDYDHRPIDIMLMYRITGGAQYLAAAIALVDAQVTAAAAAGTHPDVSGDSYLGVGEMIGALAATYPYASAAQQARWKPYADQAIFNVWNPLDARWNGQAAPWSGWSINNPNNNYFYSFMQATMWWALASGSTAIVHDGKTALEYLRTDRLPLMQSAYAQIPGGGSYEGTGYGIAQRSKFELVKVWRDSGQGDLRDAHLTNSVDYMVHATVPTMDRYAPIGDLSRESVPWVYDYHRAFVAISSYQTDAPAERKLAGWWFDHISHGDGSPYDEDQNSYSFRYDLIPHVANAPAPIALTFRAPETGAIFARTSWSRQATWFDTLMSSLRESHAHQEQGGFTFFGAGDWLAVTQNIWSSSGIHQDTGQENIPRFQRGSTVIAQKFSETARVNVGTYIANPITGETHVCGDISPIYADAGVRWSRCEDFVNGALTITDTTTLGAGVTAFEQLQFPTAPTVNGNVITTPHLRATILSPTNAVITVTDFRTVQAAAKADPQQLAERTRELSPAQRKAAAKLPTVVAGDYGAGYRAQWPITTDSQIKLEVLP